MSTSVEETTATDAAGQDGRARGLWWLSPTGAVAFVVPATLLLAWVLPDPTYRALWRTPKALDGGTTALLLSGTLLFMTAGLLPLFGGRRPRRAAWPSLTDDQYRLLLRASRWLLGLTLFGYAAFLFSGIRNGASLQMIVAALVRQDTFTASLESVFTTVPGVTTLTQVGIAYVTVATILLLRGPAPGATTGMVLVFGLATVRSFILSERLAILELLIPVVAVVAMAKTTSGRRWVRVSVRAGPALVVPIVFLVFGFFEYSRSWVFYRETSGGSFFDFVVERLAGYYATAYNNGQLALLHEAAPDRVPYRTLEALWTAPGVEQLNLYATLSPGHGPGEFQEVLARYGNPEFNNPCGVCDPFVDWGPLGGLIILALLGLLLGSTYVSFANSHAVGLLLYPPLVTGLLELPRYLYWSQGRLVPALTLLAVTAWLVIRAGPRRRGTP